jgi:E3 ubiquitin-protein ligase HECTD2
VAELQAVTVYEGFIPTDNTVRFFWQVVDRFSFDEQKKLLRFITGTDRIPAVGLASLHLKICKSAHSYSDNSSSSPNSNSNDPHHPSSPPSSSSRRRLRLSAAIPSASVAIPMARKERIPESHTCFNQLILSEFESPESLELKLRLAINESEGFSLN